MSKKSAKSLKHKKSEELKKEIIDLSRQHFGEGSLHFEAIDAYLKTGGNID